MAVTLNGTSSFLVHQAAAGSILPAGGYPFSMFAWVKMAATIQSGFAAVLETLAADSNNGANSHTGLLMGSSTRAYQSQGSGVYVAANRAGSTGDWVPVLIVCNSTTSRLVYYGPSGTTPQSDNSTAWPMTAAALGKAALLTIGTRYAMSGGTKDNFLKGDIACVGIWSSALTQTDFDTLAGGAIPSTVQASTLVEYWSLLTATTLTGSKGARTLTATSITTASGGHPITESADTTLPALTGTLTASAITSSSYTLTWPAGSDNVAVTSYEVSLNNGGSYTDVGNVLTYNVTGRSPSTTDQCLVRAKDAAGNVSTPPLSANVTLSAASDGTPPTLTGTITVSALTPTSYTLAWPAGSDNVAVTAYEYSLDGGSSYTGNGTALTVNITGRTASTTDNVRVRARDAAGNASTPVLSTTVNLPAATDTVNPTMTGGITVSNLTTWGFRATWPAATDNVAVVGYEVSTDGGTSWQDIGGGRLVKGFVNHAWKGTTVQLRVRAYDAAGNRSTALSAAVSVPTDAGSTVVRRSINPAGGADFTSLQAWNDAAPSDLTVNVTSTCQAGSTTSAVVLNAGASATTRAYVNNTLTIGGETRLITAYDPSTKIATVGAVNSGGAAAFSSAPAAGASYTVGPVIWQGEVPNIEISGVGNGSQTYFMNTDGAVTSASAYKHLTAAPGAAWCDNANVLTNAVRYNAANGAAISFNAGSLSATTIDLTSGGGGGYVRLSRLQVRSIGNNTTGWGGFAVHTSSPNKPCWVDRCIIESGTWNFVYSPNYASHLLTNSWVIGTRPVSAQATHTADDLAELADGSMVFNSLFVAINSQTYQRAHSARTNNVEFYNCGFFGVGVVQDMTLSGNEAPGPRYSNCFSDAGSLPSGVSYAAFNTTNGAGFQNITYGTHDLRIKTSSALKDAGIATTGLPTAIDAAGSARPQGAAWDVGPWEVNATAGNGTLVTEAFRDPVTNALLASTAIPNVVVINPATRGVVLSLAAQTTAADGTLTISDAALVSGTTYLVVAFNASGSQRGAKAFAAV